MNGRRMDLSLARQRLATARVARLGTITREGRPHLVPCCFALVDGPPGPTFRDVAYTAVDGKPKSTQALRRLDNIEHHREVSLLVDHFDEDWSQLWWVRLDGWARIVDSPTEVERARDLLKAKYPQYGVTALDGPVIAIDADRWSAWSSHD
jgi:PPOX class probable F420-dependent enzyme